jgi:UDP-glucose 4-epimerase
MNYWKDRSVVILGGAGFIGSHLADRLQKEVKSLTIVDAFVENSGANANNIASLVDAGVKLIRERVEDVASWGSILNTTDLIFNLAALNAHKESMKDPVRDFHANVMPHLQLALYCQKLSHPVKIVFASSRSVYGSATQNPVSEDTLPQPKDFYGAHTLFAEHYFRLCCEKNVSVSCVRFSNVFGPRQRLIGSDIGLWGELLRAALQQQPMEIYESGGDIRDTIYIKDLVEALLLISKNSEDEFQIINIGGIPLAVKRFAECVQLSLPDAKIIRKPMPESLQSIQVGDFILDSSLMVKKFGWQATSEVRESIHETLTFFLKNRKHYL